jgi:hypothetical protein
MLVDLQALFTSPWAEKAGALVVGRFGHHNCVSDFQNSLILIADEFLDPGIILAEVTDSTAPELFC